MMGGSMMGGSGFAGLGTFGLIGMILNLVITVGIIIGIVALVIWVIRRLDQTGAPGATSGQVADVTTPSEVVRLRYARGEITREQYKELLADLG